MKRRPPRTVLEYAVAKGGIRKGLRVGTCIAQWTIAQSQLGHEPTIREVAAWWREPERTWYRRLDEFRAIFDAETPAAIATRALAEREERLDRKDVGRVIAGLGGLVVA